MGQVRRWMMVALVGAGLTGCDHPGPFAIQRPEHYQPDLTSLPARLTFNPRTTTTPFVVGDTILFGWTDPARRGNDRCIATMPLDSGIITGLHCPGGSRPDTIRDAWSWAVPSPAGDRVAFIREQFVPVRSTLPIARQLVVGPRDVPDAYTVVVAGSITAPWGVLGNQFTDLSWADDSTVRFVGGLEAPTGSGRFTPFGVFAAPADGGPPRFLAGTDSVFVYVPRPNGDLWVVRTGDSTAVIRVRPTGDTSLVIRFPAPVVDITTVQGRLVAAAPALGIVQVTATGGLATLWAVDGVTAVAGAPTRPRVVALIANMLWLVEARE